MSREPVWLSIPVVLAIHERQIAEHGGLSGVAAEADATVAVLHVASGDLSEPEFARWLGDHVQPA